MKRAAVSVLAVCVLAPFMPAVLQAQDDAFRSRAAAALEHFGEAFRSKCYPPALSRPLRIAVAEMAPSRKVSDSAVRMITDRIEEVLENDPLFVIVPRRVSAELSVARQELLNARLAAPDAQIDGIITIAPDADAKGKPAVKVVAYTVNEGCQRNARTLIAAGDIKDPPDSPEPFFRDAARRLPDRAIERLMVMPPDLGIGFGSGNAVSVTAQGLQEKLASAIRETLEKRSLMRLTESSAHVGLAFADRMALSGAWQARLHLRRSAQGIDVRVEFRDPAGATVRDATGHFAADLLPVNFDPPVLEVRAGKPAFNAGAHDKLDVRVRVLRPSSLFCFVLAPEQGEEATLLYPTSESLRDRDNVFGPQDGEMPILDRFTRGIGVEITMEKPLDEFFHCIATPQPPPDRLKAQWLKNTLRARAGRGVGYAADPVTAREILSGLRQIDGAAEAFAEIVSE
jgi:hypothetical protein